MRIIFDNNDSYYDFPYEVASFKVELKDNNKYFITANNEINLGFAADRRDAIIAIEQLRNLSKSGRETISWEIFAGNYNINLEDTKDNEESMEL